MLDIVHAMYFGIGCPSEYFHSVLQSKWPNDVFKKPNIHYDNICNQLKSIRRVHREAFFERLFIWIYKKISSLYSMRDMRILNGKVQMWNCKLRPELRWLASVDVFRNAYYELCQYMSFK